MFSDPPKPSVVMETILLTLMADFLYFQGCINQLPVLSVTYDQQLVLKRYVFLSALYRFLSFFLYFTIFMPFFCLFPCNLFLFAYSPFHCHIVISLPVLIPFFISLPFIPSFRLPSSFHYFNSFLHPHPSSNFTYVFPHIFFIIILIQHYKLDIGVL